MSDLIKVLVVALHTRVEFDNACPRDGMGPTTKMLLNEILNEVNITLPEDQFRLVLASYELRYPRNW